MDLPVYIFDILLDVFIVVTIFAIYLYVLFRYYMHDFEITGLTYFFKKHLSFYTPIIKLYKLSEFHRENPNYIPNYVNDKIKNVKEKPDNTDYSIATGAILGFILGLLFICTIYFIIYRKQIIEQITLYEVLIKIVVNAMLILIFELLFVYYVYGNTDLINFMKIFNLY
jgi:hypothetical protein